MQGMEQTTFEVSVRDGLIYRRSKAQDIVILQQAPQPSDCGCCISPDDQVVPSGECRAGWTTRHLFEILYRDRDRAVTVYHYQHLSSHEALRTWLRLGRTTLKW
jgi:hypothetical protein